MVLRVCTKCKTEKPTNEFSPRGKTYKSHCKQCVRDWYMVKRDSLLPYKKEYYRTHKADVKKYPSYKSRAEYGKQYRESHKEDTAQRNKLFRKLNPQYSRQWYQANLESRRKYHREWATNRRNQDLSFRLLDNTRRRLRSALDGKTKSKRTLEILGCSVEHLRKHLSSLFAPGMSWDNYGEWEVDHKEPCASFDLSNEDELLKCFHFSNLQPLWSHENRVKSSKVI